MWQPVLGQWGVGGDPTVRIDRGTLDVSDPSKWQDGGVVNMNGNQIHVFKAPDGSTIRVNPQQIRAAGGDPMKAAMSQFSDKVQNGDVDMDELFPSRAAGTYEGGIRTADANGNPIDLSPEEAAKVNAARSVRSQMEGGAGGAAEEMPDNVKNALGYTDEGELDLEQVPRSPRLNTSSVPAAGGGASDEMPAHVKNALGYTDEGELDLEQAPRISRVDTSNIKRRPGESVAKWVARKKAAELKGMRDQLLKAGYGKTTVTPTGTRTTLNGRIVGGQFIPN